jgi:ubiquinone/menaquinone biosynthesis C-methylase UbiE
MEEDSSLYHFMGFLGQIGATDLHPYGRRGSSRTLEALDLKDGQRVLEVGCGTGGTLIRAAVSARVLADGVDVLPTMIRTGRLRVHLTGLAGRIRLTLVSPREALPFPDASFDRIYLEGVLGFQDEPAARALLTDIRRLLRSDGRCVLNEAIWKPSVPDDLVQHIHTATMRAFGIALASEQNWSLEGWSHLMREAGFEIVSRRLTDEHIRQSADNREVDPRLILSHILSLVLRLQGHVVPSLRRRRAAYHEAEERHRNDNRHIEFRLFVLRKRATAHSE